jgi:anaerobic carbon-monoxide dehydrogenase iron sulfur subunit
MKILTVDLDRCIGCRSCEYACSFARTGDFRDDSSSIWVHVSPEGRWIGTFVCAQCESPICLQVCPRRAIERDPKTNAVVVDEVRCMGCKLCLQSCPFGCISFAPEKRVIRKCDLCRGDPSCVKVCMSQALDYVEVNDLPKKKRSFIDHRLRIQRVVYGGTK